ncbi:MAG: isoleucine--tRNA ligase [Methanobacteriota archaeon]
MKVPDKRYDPKSIEPKYAEFWSKTRAYERARNLRSKGKEFFFVDGPPYASGPVHMGTARNKVLKDAMLRFRRMQGFNVRDQPGFDMHGLPIEIQIEKALGFERKRQIDDGGVDKFVMRCREMADANQKQMTAEFADLGIWMDWNAPYLSSSNDYIESAWWTLKKLHSSEHLVREERAVPWCPRCETALSEQEISYAGATGDSIFFKLPLRGKRDEYLLIWVTTPWTIIGNLAVAVNPELNYAKVKIRKGGKVETMYLLEDNVEAMANATGIEAYEITETLKGDRLVGLQYFHPLMADVPYLKGVKGEWVHKVVPSAKVTKNHTGVVHVAPGFSSDDFDIAKAHGLPAFSPVDERAVFTTESGLKYAGKTLAEASKQVVSDLASMRFLLHAGQGTHRQGMCWRCRTPLMHRASKQWFVKASDAREKMMRGIKAINWAPQYAGSSNVYCFADKARDWCVSRQRYWGIPMPVWECITDMCGHVEIVGSVKELKGVAGFRDGMDLHRPALDSVRLDCPKCGGAMKRVPDVLDVWFDASVATWAQLGYPSKRDEFKRWWPCDWVTEAHDQAKGWLYVQIVASSLVFDRMPYKSALVHGWICDQSGKPMSKTSGNAVSPMEAIDGHGRDALRVYLIGKVAPWEDIRYNPEDVHASVKFLNTLWNVYRFAASYMNMDAYDMETNHEIVQKSLTPEDRWVLSRLETLKDAVASEMQAQSMHKALGAIEDYVLADLSRWYLKLVRERAWSVGQPEDKKALYWTMSEVLGTLSKLLAPFTPYLAEDIYQNVDGKLVSVHMCDWPASFKERHDLKLEEQMLVAREIASAANQARQLVGHKLRWPVKRITVEVKDQKIADAVGMFEQVIKKQANTKEIEVVPSGHEWAGLEIQVHPNPNVIGKAYKLWEKKIARMLEIRPAKKIKEDIEKGVYKLGIEGQLIEILPEMVTFTTKLPSNIVRGEIAGGSVFVNVEVDDEIRSEGLARDVIRRMQEMRKDIEMDVEDFIKATVSADDEVQPSLERWEDTILAETRCSELAFGVDVEEEYVVEWPMGGHNVVLGITPIRMKVAVQEFMKVPGIEKSLAVAIFTSGFWTLESVTQAPKEDALKIPGMSHAVIRSIHDWLEMPDGLKEPTEITCPVCEKTLGQGAVECQRCGASLIPGEGLEGDGDVEGELTSALEETLSEEDGAPSPAKIAERGRKLLEVIEDMRKPSPVEQRDDALVELTKDIGSAPPQVPEPQLASVPEAAAQEPRPAPQKIVTVAVQLPSPEPAEEEEAMSQDMDSFVQAVTEGASVSKQVARSLYRAGYDTTEKLGAASEDDLRRVDKVGKVTARKVIEAFSTKAKPETQMCSLCNAIVSLSAKKCPRCGTQFEGDDEQETKLIEKQMKTVEALDKKLSARPEDPNLLYSKAMTVLEQGNADEARQLLRAALDSEPNHQRAREALDSLSPKTDLIVEAKEPQQSRAPQPEELAPEVIVAEAQAGARVQKAAEEDKPEPEEMDLKDGFTYLVREDRSLRAYKLLKKYIESGRKGFCVTRNFPDKIREMYGLGETPILWLSNVGTKDSVRPKDLEKLSLSLEQFLAKQGGIILLDGLEYLITNNSFITVLRLIQSLRDQVAINRSILVMPVNPDTMSSNELNNLEKEVDLVLS